MKDGLVIIRWYLRLVPANVWLSRFVDIVERASQRGGRGGGGVGVNRKRGSNIHCRASDTFGNNAKSLEKRGNELFRGKPVITKVYESNYV